MAKEQLNVRLDTELIKTVKRICLEKDIKLQEAVAEALQMWIEKNQHLLRD